MPKSWKRAASTAFVAALVAGCGQKSSEEKPAEATPAVAEPQAPTGPTVTLTGSIHFEGTPPERKPLKMSADDSCHKQHTEPVLSEDVVVGPGGGLANVFVSVTGGLEARTFAPPAVAVVLDQKGCVYTPHVFGVMARQTIKLLNSDPTLHNVHAIPEKGNEEFNLGMPKQGMEIPKSFKNPGVVRFRCDVHPWMLSWGIVTTHPYYGVSDASGHYSIPNLPAGQYTIEAWHEKLGTKSGTVTVTVEGAPPTLDFTFAAAAQ